MSLHLATCNIISYVSHILPQCNVCMPSSSGVAKTFEHLHCCPSKRGTTLQARKLLVFVLLFLFYAFVLQSAFSSWTSSEGVNVHETESQKPLQKFRVDYWFNIKNDRILISSNWLTDFVVVVKNLPYHCQIHVSRHHHKWQKVLHCHLSKLDGITQLYHKSFNKQVAAVFSVSVNIDFDFDCPSHLIQNMSISQWEVFLAKQRKWGSKNEESVAKKTKSATNSAQN